MDLTPSPTPHLDAALTTHEGVWVRLAFVDLAQGDLVAGILLSQIAYWHAPARGGGSKLTVERDGHLWLVKARDDWWAEARLSEKQVRRGLSVLRDAGLVETSVWKWNGTPHTHVRLVREAMEEALAGLSSGANGLALEGQSERPQEANGLAPEGQTSSTPKTTDTDHSEGVDPEVHRLCELLADLMVENGCKRPNVTKRWLDACRLLMERDGWEPERVETIIRWSQADEFWRANVLSMPKLREKFDQLRLARNRALEARQGTAGQGQALTSAEAALHRFREVG